MDLYAIIQELHQERKRLDRLIAVLERKLAHSLHFRNRPKSRRGRKSMGQEERKLVSERMKRYWASRRGENGSAGDGGATDSSIS